MNILLIGDSNSSGRGSPPYPTSLSDNCKLYGNDGILYEPITEPSDIAVPDAVDNDGVSATGSCATAMLNDLYSVDSLGTYVLAHCDKGGATIKYSVGSVLWNSSGVGTIYQKAIDRALDMGGIDYLVILLGDNDAKETGVDSWHLIQWLQIIINRFRVDVSNTALPVIVVGNGWRDTTGDDESWFNTRMAFKWIDDQDKNIHYIGGFIGEPHNLGDLPHLTQEGYNSVGRRVAAYINYLRGLLEKPVLVNALNVTSNKTHIYVELTDSSFLVPQATELTGWRFWNNGSLINPISIILNNRTVIATVPPLTKGTIQAAFADVRMPDLSTIVSANSLFLQPFRLLGYHND